MRRLFALGLVAALGGLGCGDCGGTNGARSRATDTAPSASSQVAELPGEAEAFAVVSSASLGTEPPPASPSAVAAMSELEAAGRVAGEAGRLVLTEPGREPRRLLRHAAKTGKRVKLTLAYDLSMVQTQAAVETPAAEDAPAAPIPGFAFDTTWLSGPTGWNVRIEGAHTLAGSETEQLLADEVAPLMAALAGTSAIVTLDPRAVSFALVSGPNKLDSDGLQLWSSLEETVRELLVPVPEEAVGTGARWRSLSRLSRGGMAFVRTTDYELREGSGVVLGLVFKEEPVAPKVRDPLLPEGVEVRVSRGIGGGTGTLEFDADLSPRRAVLALESMNELEINVAATSPVRSSVRLRQSTRVSQKP